MPTQGQPYITLQELGTFGVSQQFLKSPLLTAVSVTTPWSADTAYGAGAPISPTDWSDVSHTGSGPASAVGVSGAPLESTPVDFQISIDGPGAVGTATFSYSFDGGVTFTGPVPTASSVELEGSGVTLTFAVGSYVSGDTYSATYSNNDLFYLSTLPAGETSGTTGPTEPTFPTGQGQSVLDGEVTWVCQGENSVRNVIILGASETVDGFLRPKYILPLLSYGYDLKRLTAWIAAYDLANVRGYNPAIPAEDTFRIRYEQAIAMLKNVANGVYNLDIMGQTSQEPGQPDPTLGPVVVSPNFPPRQWAPGTRGAQWR